MSAATTAELVVRLSQPGERARVAQQLALAVGAERLIVLVRDPALGVLLPAPGFTQTLYGGGAWRAFVGRCSSPGRHSGEVDLPPGSRGAALALSADGIVAVFIGGEPAAGELDEVERLLPMLSVALRAEQELLLARGEAVEARRAAGRAETLAHALEAARAEHAKLNAELRAEHRRKDDFLAMLAHELRNPLTPLVNSIELLRRGVLEPSASERMLEVAARQVNQLIRLVEDLLDVSRVSHGRIELRRQPIELAEVLTHAVEAIRPVLAARRHEIKVTLPAGPVTLLADGARLTQVFSNLLHNAAKYTDPGGRIEISAASEGGQIVVRVKDNGVGIAPDMLAKVFDLFTQVPGSMARAQGGLGIGLTLVRSLVELHGGEVRAESAGAGAGSSFVVRLPLAGAEAHRVRADAPAAGDASARLNILIVDDNEDAADTLAETLSQAGHHVEVCYSGAKALQVAADLEPQLIFLDLGLPELDGYEVAARLRRFLSRRARFVALTGYGSDEDKRRTREAGFDEHIVKPVRAEELQAIVARSTTLIDGRGAQAAA